MRFNSIKPENLTCSVRLMSDRLMTFQERCTASAWPTKAGPVRASVNSDKLRDPSRHLPDIFHGKCRYFGGTAISK